MELRHLRYFIAVAEELHFARAADRLQMAQQPLSAAIRRLEDELHVTLFERSTRRVMLTETGRVFLARAYQMMAAAEEAVQAAQEAERGERGEIRVGYTGTTLYNIMPPLIRAFREQFPHIRVILHEMACNPGLEEQVMARNLDVVLTGDTVYPGRLESLVLCREPVVVVVPEHHPLAADGPRDIRLRELDNQPFIQYDRFEKLATHQQIVTVFQAAGIRLNNVQEATSEQAMIGLAAAGIGLSIVSSSLSVLRGTEVVYRRLIEPSVDIEFSLVWQRDRLAPVVRSFVQLAQQIFGVMVTA